MLYDVHGLVHPERDDLYDYQRSFARLGPRTLAEGAGRGRRASSARRRQASIDAAMIRSMARFPIVLALAMPEPEIGYEAARAVRRDVIVATSFIQNPNAISDLLSFPYIFRGALDVRASRISVGMMLAAARALADLAREEVTEEVEPGLRERHLHLRPGVPAAQAHRSAHPGARVAGRGGAGGGRGAGRGTARRRELRGRPHRPPGDRARR